MVPATPTAPTACTGIPAGSLNGVRMTPMGWKVTASSDTNGSSIGRAGTMMRRVMRRAGRAPGPSAGRARRPGPRTRPGRGSPPPRSSRPGRRPGTRRRRRAAASASGPATLPANMIVAPNSPSERAQLITSPAASAVAASGIVIDAEDLPLRRPVDARRILEVVVDRGEPGPRRPDEERRRHERLGDRRPPAS